jgi:sodium/bile acid cotransporter 7
MIVIERIEEIVKKFRFFSALTFVLILAYLMPSVGKTGGLIASQYTIKYFATCLLFFLTGFMINKNVYIVLTKNK